jgi:acetyl-CoA acyltransferase
LLGPAYVVPKLLDATGLKLSDISVFEFHGNQKIIGVVKFSTVVAFSEAFAGQVLANLKALESKSFANNFMRRPEAVGTINM